MNIQTLGESIVETIMRAQRPMPAKFNSDHGRKMSFGTLFSWLDENDEYDLASAVWNIFTKTFGQSEDKNEKMRMSAALTIGEDIALASYARIKMFPHEDFSVSQDKIIRFHVGNLDTPLQVDNNLRKFWTMCEVCGKGIAMRNEAV